MCGRFTLTSPVESVREAFGFAEIPNLPARANVAPGQEVLCVRREEDGQRHARFLKWGLVPFWADEAAIGNRMINARAESVADKPGFRHAFAQRRCLIPADGFYEWKTVGTGPKGKPVKQPYRAVVGGQGSDGEPFAFAGLWERNDKVEGAAAGAPLETCTILTTDANAALHPVHPRMPVILPPDACAVWLDPEATREDLLALLKPFPAERMRVYPVSTKVNSVANDDPGLLAEVAPADAARTQDAPAQAPKPAPKQGSLF
jgi:putative SOS response-associated peptidase YedK